MTMKDKFEEDDKLFSGLYYQIGKHQANKVSEDLENLRETVEDLPYPHALDDWFEEFLKEQKREERTRQNKKKIHTFTKNVAIFLLLLTGGVTLTTFSVEAFRMRVFNLVSEISEKYSKIEFVEKDSLSNESVAIPWDLYFYPEYLPAGYKVESTLPLGDVKLIYFSDATGKTLEFSTSPSNSSFQVDTENATTKRITIHGAEGILVYKDGMHTLLWTNNEKTFYLIGTLSEEEIIKVAESVVVKEK